VGSLGRVGLGGHLEATVNTAAGQSVKFEAVVRIYRTENAVGSMGQFQKFLEHSIRSGRLH
jgi:hypothetical protein